MVTIRYSKPSDHSDINKIRTANHPKNYYEGDESFESKIKEYPEGCFIADLDGVVGYLISFPYILGKPHPINEKYTPIDNPTCYYIHDVCILPEFRKMQIAKKLVEKILEMEWQVVCLLAIMNSKNFWYRLGFRSFFEIEHYGLKTEYMLRIK